MKKHVCSKLITRYEIDEFSFARAGRGAVVPDPSGGCEAFFKVRMKSDDRMEFSNTFCTDIVGVAIFVTFLLTIVFVSEYGGDEHFMLKETSLCAE